MITTLIILSFSIILIFNLGYFFRISYLKSIFIFIWHTIFCMAFIYYSQNNVSDALTYYTWATDFNYEFRFGAMAVVNFNELFIDYLKLNYINLNLVYNFIGCIGIFSLASLLNDIKTQSNKIYLFSLLILFLPSLHFWTSGIGKDTIVISFTLLFFWSLQNFRKRFLFSFISLIIIFVVRDYIFYLILTSIILSSISFLFVRNNKTTSIYIVFFIIIFFLFMSILQLFNFIPSFIEEILEFIKARQSRLSSFDTSMDFSNKPYFYLLFSYLFRPFIFDINNLYSFIISLENLILLSLIIYLLPNLINYKISSEQYKHLIILLFFISSIIVMSIITVNYGISLRQKWMFLPIFLYQLIYFKSLSKN